MRNWWIKIQWFPFSHAFQNLFSNLWFIGSESLVLPLPGKPPETMTAEIDRSPLSGVGIWTPPPPPPPHTHTHHLPVLIKISAEMSPLIVKHFAINTNVLFMKKQLIWVFESRESVYYWWSYISFAPECKELTCMLDPLLYRWGVPPVVIRCVYWTLQRGVPADLDHPSEPYHRNADRRTGARTHGWTYATKMLLRSWQVMKENTPSRVVRGGRSLAGTRRRNPTPKAEVPTPDASKWSPDSHHPTSGCFPFIPYLLME